MARAFRSTVGWHFSDTPAQRLTEWHQKAGQIHLGVPVLGRPEAAASGQLFLVAAGAASALATCQPLFDRLGQKTFLMGETPRDAQVPMPTATTLYNQFLTALGRGGKNWDLCGLGKVSEDNAGLSS